MATAFHPPEEKYKADALWLLAELRAHSSRVSLVRCSFACQLATRVVDLRSVAAHRQLMAGEISALKACLRQILDSANRGTGATT
ncbi:hypothetical protein QTH90_00225 [Variovorax sp. J2P1-59]|uniref:hypothetical protein n=1 Tax=Variovorax flavidus TaxID=3053501 RepID=UPI002577B848|nr:hypothetical protein [Variovorax sp. J2P1-59]MDM0072790.1 hypothetical protein [Variovorax sp. J2P1-59]